MNPRSTLFAISTILALAVQNSSAETITDARYEHPVEHYGHFALGRPHEYARLNAKTDTGRELVFELPANVVFEDLAPRLVRLAKDTPSELLAIVSNRDTGARLVMIRLSDGRLEISAQSPAIGTPMRWLNPVAVADLDGDGRAEISAVITPHIGGTLKVYRRQGGELVEVAALDGFSNHVYGTAELGLATAVSISGSTRLLVPDTTRRQLRVVTLMNKRLVETGRCRLPEQVIGAVTVKSLTAVSVGLSSGRQVIDPGKCTG